MSAKSFSLSKNVGEFRAIPAKQARKYCPPASCSTTSLPSSSSSSSQQPRQALLLDSSSNPLILLSVAGFTLGGVFCIEYTDSPIGAYREVAILSNLVGLRPSFMLPSIGAWASHIFVDSAAAADYGARYWGLPAAVMSIDFKSDEDNDSSTSSLTAAAAATTTTTTMARTGSNVMFSNRGIEVSGWNCFDETTTTGLPKTKSWLSSSNLVDLSLPSFSGCLPVVDEEGGGGISMTSRTPLLQYPLRIHHPQSIAVVESGDIRFADDDSNDRRAAGAIAEVKELLTNCHPLLSLDIGPVQLEAGPAELIAS